jgi:hypothetical protein
MPRPKKAPLAPISRFLSVSKKTSKKTFKKTSRKSAGVGCLRHHHVIEPPCKVQSGWKWNEWRKALSVLTILHEERRKREERRESCSMIVCEVYKIRILLYVR